MCHGNEIPNWKSWVFKFLTSFTLPYLVSRSGNARDLLGHCPPTLPYDFQRMKETNKTIFLFTIATAMPAASLLLFLFSSDRTSVTHHPLECTSCR